MLKAFLSGLIVLAFSMSAGALSLVEDERSQFIFDVRGDIWSSPYVNKETPTRSYELRLNTFLVKKQEYSLEAFAGVKGFSTGRADLVVGPRRVLVGSDLRDQGVGIHLHHNNADGANYDLTVEYESASDNPFNDQRDIWTEVRLIYRLAEVDHGRWLFLFNDSKNRGFLNGSYIVLPGYAYQPDDEFAMIVGLPFLKLAWFKNTYGNLYLDILPTQAELRLEKSLDDKITYEARLGLETKSYLHANRTENDLRLFVQEAFIENSFKFVLSETTSIKLNLGYGFDRFLYEGKQIYLATSRYSTMPSDVYGGARWEWNF